MKACYVCKPGGRLDYVYTDVQKAEFAKRLEILPDVIRRENCAEHREFLRECEVILATWDMVDFTEEELAEYFPKLRLVLYAAASVRYFAEPFLRRGVTVLSAWREMAIPVAEYTLGAILHANKGFYLAMRRYRDGTAAEAKRIVQHSTPGTYGTNVGIIGAGAIGSLVIEMLRGHSVHVKVFDPFLSDERAAALGAQKCSLEELFSTCQTISNHLANNAQTVGMLNYDLFRRMLPNAAFINSARGAQVVEEDLVRALREEPDRCALLDVTWPEPCAPDHPFRTMPNVFLTPHIAGYATREVERFSDCMVRELDGWLAGKESNCRVTLEMLATMA